MTSLPHDLSGASLPNDELIDADNFCLSGQGWKLQLASGFLPTQEPSEHLSISLVHPTALDALFWAGELPPNDVFTVAARDTLGLGHLVNLQLLRGDLETNDPSEHSSLSFLQTGCCEEESIISASELVCEDPGHLGNLQFSEGSRLSNTFPPGHLRLSFLHFFGFEADELLKAMGKGHLRNLQLFEGSRTTNDPFWHSSLSLLHFFGSDREIVGLGGSSGHLRNLQLFEASLVTKEPSLHSTRSLLHCLSGFDNMSFGCSSAFSYELPFPCQEDAIDDAKDCLLALDDWDWGSPLGFSSTASGPSGHGKNLQLSSGFCPTKIPLGHSFLNFLHFFAAVDADCCWIGSGQVSNAQPLSGFLDLYSPFSHCNMSIGQIPAKIVPSPSFPVGWGAGVGCGVG